MGLFDRKSTTTNETLIENRNIAAEGVDGPFIANSQGVTITDAGAIGGIRDTALGAISANQRGLDASLDFGRNALLAVGSAFEQAGAQTQRVLETTTGGSPASGSPLNRFDIQRDAIRYSALAAAVIAAIYVYQRG